MMEGSSLVAYEIFVSGKLARLETFKNHLYPARSLANQIKFKIWLSSVTYNFDWQLKSLD
jgi:hypothetical protein